MERLWTPWRLAYVSGGGESNGCVFCHALTDEDAAPLIVFRGTTCFVILNLFPYNYAHLMVVPNRHVATLGEASAARAPLNCRWQPWGRAVFWCQGRRARVSPTNSA